MLKSTLLFPAEHPQEADAPPASPFYADLSWPVSGEGLAVGGTFLPWGPQGKMSLNTSLNTNISAQQMLCRD